MTILETNNQILFSDDCTSGFLQGEPLEEAPKIAWIVNRPTMTWRVTFNIWM